MITRFAALVAALGIGIGLGPAGCAAPGGSGADAGGASSRTRPRPAEGTASDRRAERPAGRDENPGDGGYMAETAVKQPEGASGDTAVDTALNWAKKYARAMERVRALEKRTEKLRAEKKELREKIAPLRKAKQRAERELAEANEMLMELRDELENWKRDVLGFRGEIRNANQAQSAALRKILKLLGGEVSPALEKQARDPDATGGEAATKPGR